MSQPPDADRVHAPYEPLPDPLRPKPDAEPCCRYHGAGGRGGACIIATPDEMRAALASARPHDPDGHYGAVGGE
jgi:hypothetical protein